MKVSISTGQHYSNVPLKQSSVFELEKIIGAQLGAVEETIEWAPRFEGLLVAKVVSCEKHPDADRLNVCRIDDGGAMVHADRGEDGLVQVVCGAPNVKAGMTVAWIPPGFTVPSTYGTDDPFILAPKELRGIVSNGMLASPQELGISDDHDGILEILVADVGSELMKPGTAFSRLYGLDDVVYDIENKMFTHRPDCFGMLGVARELAGIQGKAFVSPEWYTTPQIIAKTSDLSLDVRIEATDMVPRFMAIAMDGIVVRKSPTWLQAALVRVGIRPINNVVDVTNFVMYVTGQPLHAYDYDKLSELSGEIPTLVARVARKGDTVDLLSGKTLQAHDGKDILISTDSGAVVGLAGVMGSANSEVDERTTRIVLEAANFDMYAIRRASMRHGLFTEAVTRFNKGQSPRQNDRIIWYAVKQMMDLADGRVASDMRDEGEFAQHEVVISVTPSFINDRLGSSLSADDMKQMLENVECRVSATGEHLDIVVPFWRTDLEIAEDIVEEVGRLHGYDKLQLTLPKRTIQPAIRNDRIEMKRFASEALSRAGANELLTYTFVKGDLLDRSGHDKQYAFKLSNALSPELQYYRMSLTPSLLEKVHANIKAGYGEFALFEHGMVHRLDDVEDDLPVGTPRTALVVSAKDARTRGAAYYQAKCLLEFMLGALNISPVRYEPISEPDVRYPCYQPGRSARIIVGETSIGIVGEYNAEISKALKLPEWTAGFELDTASLVSCDKSYHALSRYPGIEQDVCLRVADEVTYQQLFDEVDRALKDAADEDMRYSLAPVDIYRPSEDSEYKQITLRISLQSDRRTLTEQEATQIVETLAHSANEALGAELV